MTAGVEWARRRVGSKVMAGGKFVGDALLEKSVYALVFVLATSGWAR